MIVTTRLTVRDKKIPRAFSGFRILQITDLHDAQFGPEQRDLLAEVKKARPDMIALTGDFVGSAESDLDRMLRFLGKLPEIAPAYYVTGNHEIRLKPEDFDRFVAGIADAGITVLRNALTEVRRGDAGLQVLGIDDPGFVNGEDWHNDPQAVRAALDAIPYDPGRFTLLLSHRPEVIRVYAEKGIDLVLSGHTHGGQIRLPLIGAFYVPMQGWFPKYDRGLFTEGKTRVFICTGLGASVVRFRFNVPPELALITLESE